MKKRYEEAEAKAAGQAARTSLALQLQGIPMASAGRLSADSGNLETPSTNMDGEGSNEPPPDFD
jgi:hypothetical protein